MVSLFNSFSSEYYYLIPYMHKALFLPLKLATPYLKYFLLIFRSLNEKKVKH